MQLFSTMTSFTERCRDILYTAAEAERRRQCQTEPRRSGGMAWRSMAVRDLSHERVQLIRVEERVLVYYCRSLVREIDLADQRSTAVDRWSQPSNCKGCVGNEV